jgi:hypothetical protein
VIRLTGLPSVARYPSASVSRGDSALAIVFAGGGRSTRVEVPLDRLDPADDLEEVELRLLAELQRKGYRVERLPSGSAGPAS